MRFLTTDELFAVSGGNDDSGDDGAGGDGAPGRPGQEEDWCEKIEDKGKRDQCYLEKSRSQNCPGGWAEDSTPRSAGPDGITGKSGSVECKGAGDA